MDKATGDRASRRRRNIVIAKTQRKLTRIRETMAREALAAEGNLNPNCRPGIAHHLEAKRVAGEMEGPKA